MYKYVTECRCCGSSDLWEYVKFREQPLANSYHDGSAPLQTYPLAVKLCLECFHSQLSIVVRPDDMFRQYAYVSGTSQTLRDYFEWFARYTIQEWINNLSHKDRAPRVRVLDIASNDGSQLDAFRAMGCETIGVDPAENLCPIAREKGHRIIQDYWNADSADDIGPVDIITAQNVFAHTDDVLGFLVNCKKVMTDETLLFIQTSQANMFQNGEFDTIYHEHLSFFNTYSMRRLVERAGMALQQSFKTHIHGTSYVFVITLNDGHRTLKNNITAALQEEDDANLFEFDTYLNFAEHAYDTLKWIQWTLAIQREHYPNQPIVGIGAAAKGMTVLNSGRVPLDYIIDENPLKQGKLTPGMNIPIVGMEILQQPNFQGPVAFIPLAWNFFDEMREKIRAVRSNPEDVFIRYFPNRRIEP